MPELHVATVYHPGLAPELLRPTPAQELLDYLNASVEHDQLDNIIADGAWKGWKQLNHAANGLLPVPDASIGSDRQILYTWDREEHHFEAEIFTEGTIEFFYRNRVTGSLWEAEQQPTAAVSDEVKDKLALFANV